jgi:hypothetical protein
VISLVVAQKFVVILEPPLGMSYALVEEAKFRHEVFDLRWDE